MLRWNSLQIIGKLAHSSQWIQLKENRATTKKKIAMTFKQQSKKKK